MSGLRLGTLADRMPVGTMRAGHRIVVVERQARADDGRLLSDAAVVGARDRSFLEEARALLLEPADPQHATVGFRLQFFRESHNNPSVYRVRSRATRALKYRANSHGVTGAFFSASSGTSTAAAKSFHSSRLRYA